MALTNALNPDVVKLGLDDVVFQEFDAVADDESHATDSFLFQQETDTKALVSVEVFKGVEEFEVRAESAPVTEDVPMVDQNKIFTHLNYAKAVRISRNYFDDEMHSTVKKMMRDYGEKARITQDITAMNVFANGFTTSLTADGAALFSNTHTNINGDTIDNLDTATLSETSLNTGIVALGRQIDQAGVTRGHRARCLLVPLTLYKLACEITESEYRSGTANNDMNMYSSKYGLMVKTSPYLDDVSTTAWFLLAKNHNVYRFVRKGLDTELVEPKYQENFDYIYKGEYRESVGAVTYEGAWGSNGTA